MKIKTFLHTLWFILWSMWAIAIIIFWRTNNANWNIAQFILMLCFWIPLLLRYFLPDKILEIKLWKKTK